MIKTSRQGVRGEPIGRADLIDNVVTAVSSGGATCLVGDAGVGKTTVWRSCLDRLPHHSRWIFTCLKAEQPLGLAVLADLFSWVAPEHLSQLPPPQRRAVDIVLLRADGDEAGVDQRLLGMTTASLLAAMAAQDPLLLAMDDVQWCDLSSFGTLRFALRRVDPIAVSLLATARPPLEGEAWTERDVPVTPLPQSDVRTLLHQTDLHLTAGVVDRISEISAGNALYALELARLTPKSPKDIRVPGSLKALLAGRLTGLPDSCQGALLDLAVGGGTDDDASLTTAFHHGVVVTVEGRTQFEHPLLGELARELASESELRAAHERAARASTDGVQQARHLAAAATEPDYDLAKRLDAAVVDAVRRRDLYTARDLAAMALTFTPSSERPAHRLAALARCEGALGRGEAAHELALELLDHAGVPRARFVGLMIMADNPPASAALAYATEAAAMPGITEDARLEAIGLRESALPQRTDLAGEGTASGDSGGARRRNTCPGRPERLPCDDDATHGKP